ncbi:MAG TPA: RDD family protein [Gaiellaceae bacterium]|nr:RDD family protein [Gaiellaceae bacterium]
MFNRFPFGPVRGVLADEAERAIDAALAGPLPEIVGRALVERRVAERVVAAMLDASARQDGAGDAVEQVLRSPALERWLASEDAARLAAVATDRVVHSDAFRRAVADLLASPEVRKALTESATGFGEEAAEAARTKARTADFRVEAWVHRLLRRARAALPGFAGVASRGLALVVDGLLAQAAFLVAAASVGLVLGLAGGLRPGWLEGTLAGGGWLLVVGAYFALFWAGTGQTPGMRLLGVRVLAPSGETPSLRRAVVRAVGLVLAIIPLGAGFLPALVDSRRRALPDYLAGTSVTYEL